MELTPLQKQIVEWFRSGGTGISSEYLAIAASGDAFWLTVHEAEHEWCAYPCDSDDLGRCLRLIENIPEVRDLAFPVVASRCSKWKALTAVWDELASLYKLDHAIYVDHRRRLREWDVMPKRNRGPKPEPSQNYVCYKRMREILAPLEEVGTDDDGDY